LPSAAENLTLLLASDLLPTDQTPSISAWQAIRVALRVAGPVALWQVADRRA